MKTPDMKAATKIHKQMKVYCQRLGHYRMPFAWAARLVPNQVPSFLLFTSSVRKDSHAMVFDTADSDAFVSICTEVFTLDQFQFRFHFSLISI